MLEVKGNLLEADVDVIMHQVNCKGVMGAGVARQIRQKLLSEEEYQRYVTKCHAFPATELLGTYMEHATQGFRVFISLERINRLERGWIQTMMHCIRHCQKPWKPTKTIPLLYRDI